MRKHAALILLFAACDNAAAPPPALPVKQLEKFQPRTGGTMALMPAGAVEALYVDVYPVTQEMYQKVMGINPSKQKNPAAPVAGVQWVDAVRFCNKCSEAEGLEPCYDLKTWACTPTASGYRLPSELEWEIACRAGCTDRFPFGGDASQLGRHAWTKGNSEGKIHPVGQKEPNAWGLYDMLGNVWQWTNDWADADQKQRVLRGGAWDTDPSKVEISLRKKEFPVYTDACFGVDSNGFRRVKNPTLPKAGTPVVVTPPVTPTSEVKKDPPPSTPAPQGKTLPGLKGTIVFVSDRSGALEILKMHASGKYQKQLTNEKTPHADPKFSPDGKTILYTALKGGFPEVWRMNRDGSDQKKVTTGSQGSWAPDGKSIVFIRDNQCFTRELGAGAEKRLTPEKWERCGVPAWSPDGKTVAVASRHLETIGIFLVGLDGAAQAQLKTQEACCTPAWSKDAKRLLCQSVKGHCYQLEADGKNWEQVTFGADVQHDARYSPDETAFVYCRAPSPEGPWQLCVKKFDSDDFDFVQITSEGSNSLPDWHSLED
ncbi:MAG: SUMF1/EgtB/PvdO family nonheme iron enzyme [Planctomycetes bacterium]|nr:SUMF1/EgtB/PvdO family nonheme iron enzyme [Planctomycetota bacterium]